MLETLLILTPFVAGPLLVAVLLPGRRRPPTDPPADVYEGGAIGEGWRR